MRKEFLLLEEVIKEKSKNAPVYYLSNQGNYGDSLIRYGAFKFFEDIGLKYTVLKSFNTLRPAWWSTFFYRKGTLIFAGGGAWCDLYNREEILKKLSKRFKNVIILPSTYETSPSIPNATFFRRDQYESKDNMPNALFCHDMAFYIGSLEAEEGQGKGYFFRTDKESSNKIEIPKLNNDISTKGDHNTPIYAFMNEISKFDIIYTDRLHVSIAACLMGKEVHLYPGSYFKSRAIYLSSLKHYFKNIHFHDDMDFKEIE